MTIGRTLGRMLLAMAMVFLALGGKSAAAEDEINLTGIWEVIGQTQLYGRFHFFVDIRSMRFSDGRAGWHAVKRTDTRNVPANETHFRGRVDRFESIDKTTKKKSIKHFLTANVQIAFPGFNAPLTEEHVFEIDVNNQIRLATTVTSNVIVDRDEKGNESLGNDRWIYKKWDLKSFHVAAPEVKDYAFNAEANILKREIRDHEADLKQVVDRITRREQELASIIADDPDGQRAARLLREKDAALQRFVDAQKPQRTEAPPVPAPLKRMTDHLAALNGRKTEVEDDILTETRGRNRSGEISRLFARLGSIETQIRDTQAAIRRIAREEGVEIPKPGDPTAPTPEAIATAEAAYERAFRAWWEQHRRNLARPDRKIDITAELKTLRAERARLEKAIAEKTATAKGYDNGRQIAGVIVSTEGAAVNGTPQLGTVVLEAIPSDLDLDLHELRALHTSYQASFLEVERIRRAHMAEFNRVSGEVTELRDRMVSLIWESAKKQAAVELIGNLASAAVSGVTSGGVAGAAIDAVFTVVWTCAWNDGCVAFTNYDESRMQAVVRAKQAELAAEHPPDENETCSFLPQLEKVDGEHRLPAWARAVTPGQSIAPDLRMYEIGGNLASRLGAARGAMPAIDATGFTLREAALVRISERSRVFYEGAARNAITRLQLSANMRAAQEQAIRESLGRSSRRVLLDEAANAARRAAVESARSVLRNPNASRDAIFRAHRIIDRVFPKLLETERLSRLNARKAFENLDELDEVIKRETEALSKLNQKISKFRSVKAKVAGAGINVVAGVAIGYAKSALQERIKEGERDLWAEIFGKQMEASIYFNAYQRASCLYWTRLDQLASVQRVYAPLYFAYDQNSDLKVITDEVFTDDQSLLVNVALRDKDVALGTRTMIGGAPCRRISASQCRIDASEWARLQDRRPTLEFLIDLEPRDN